MGQRIGMIAGVGRLPRVLADAVASRGHELVVVQAISDGKTPRYPGAKAVYETFVGEWQRVVATLKEAGVDKVYLVGKMARQHLFAGAAFDERFQRVMRSLDGRTDSAIVLGFIADLESEGLAVGAQTELLGDLLAGPGVLAGRKPSAGEWADIARGYAVAKAVAGLDVGQTAVVKDGAVLAVEAMDGTDAAIERGAAMAGGGIVVVKVAKPHQDPRFDVPAIGLETVAALADRGGGILAFEAGATLLIDKDELIVGAEERGISLVSYKSDRAAAATADRPGG